MRAREAVRFTMGMAILCSMTGASWAADFDALLEPAPLALHSPGSTPVPNSSAAQGQLVEPYEPPLPRRLSLGINDLGAQLRLHVNRTWAGELRYLTGSASSDVGIVRANVFGLRGYRFFSERHHFTLYAGLEAAFVSTSIRSYNANNGPTSVANSSGFGETSGYALGGFGGVEYRVGRRVALDLDVGPYMIGLQEKVTHVSQANLDFVLDTAINVYLF